MRLVKIPLDPIPEGKVQRATSEHSLICGDKYYLVNIYGTWRAGKFSKQWYGWNFTEWGTSGISLRGISGDVYEIAEEQKE